MTSFADTCLEASKLLGTEQEHQNHVRADRRLTAITVRVEESA